MVAVNNPYIWGTGRRKTSTARVRIKPGTGKFLVNDRAFEAFFVTEDTRRVALQALVVTETRNNFDIWVNVDGGGITGQAGAVSLGVARALRRENENFDKLLREHGLLTRDSREVERKKYGRHKARRSTQFSKR
ncbi:MAG: 30S ribosomal protein S9 [Planctomycetes bacterium]|nr:30S ribosomal protein S9 [Planctomycetota bacterium]